MTSRRSRSPTSSRGTKISDESLLVPESSNTPSGSIGSAGGAESNLLAAERGRSVSPVPTSILRPFSSHTSLSGRPRRSLPIGTAPGRLGTSMGVKRRSVSFSRQGSSVEKDPSEGGGEGEGEEEDEEEVPPPTVPQQAELTTKSSSSSIASTLQTSTSSPSFIPRTGSISLRKLPSPAASPSTSQARLNLMALASPSSSPRLSFKTSPGFRSRALASPRAGDSDDGSAPTMASVSNFTLTEEEVLQASHGALKLSEVTVVTLVGRRFQQFQVISTLRSSLTYLSLRGCYLFRLSALADCHKLRVLDLRRNRLEQLPAADFWSGMPGLQVLHLGDNHIATFRSLAGLSSATRLTVLTLAGCPVALHPAYRHFVVNNTPALRALDGKLVADVELVEGAKAEEGSVYHPDNPKASVPEFSIDATWSPREISMRLDRYLYAVLRTLLTLSPVATIQRAWRTSRLRREIWQDLTPTIEAVTKIQRAYRSYRARKALEIFRQECLVVRYQAIWRKKFRRKRAAAVAISSAWRGWNTRREYDTMLARRLPIRVVYFQAKDYSAVMDALKVASDRLHVGVPSPSQVGVASLDADGKLLFSVRARGSNSLAKMLKNNDADISITSPISPLLSATGVGMLKGSDVYAAPHYGRKGQTMHWIRSLLTEVHPALSRRPIEWLDRLYSSSDLEERAKHPHRKPASLLNPTVWWHFPLRTPSLWKEIRVALMKSNIKTNASVEVLPEHKVMRSAAALLIQRHWRGFWVRKTQRPEVWQRLKATRAVVILQGWWRRHNTVGRIRLWNAANSVTKGALVPPRISDEAPAPGSVEAVADIVVPAKALRALGVPSSALPYASGPRPGGGRRASVAFRRKASSSPRVTAGHTMRSPWSFTSGGTVVPLPAPSSTPPESVQAVLSGGRTKSDGTAIAATLAAASSMTFESLNAYKPSHLIMTGTLFTPIVHSDRRRATPLSTLANDILESLVPRWTPDAHPSPASFVAPPDSGATSDNARLELVNVRFASPEEARRRIMLLLLNCWRFSAADKYYKTIQSSQAWSQAKEELVAAQLAGGSSVSSSRRNRRRSSVSMYNTTPAPGSRRASLRRVSTVARAGNRMSKGEVDSPKLMEDLQAGGVSHRPSLLPSLMPTLELPTVEEGAAPPEEPLSATPRGLTHSRSFVSPRESAPEAYLSPRTAVPVALSHNMAFTRSTGSIPVVTAKNMADDNDSDSEPEESTSAGHHVPGPYEALAATATPASIPLVQTADGDTNLGPNQGLSMMMMDMSVGSLSPDVDASALGDDAFAPSFFSSMSEPVVEESAEPEPTTAPAPTHRSSNPATPPPPSLPASPDSVKSATPSISSTRAAWGGHEAEEVENDEPEQPKEVVQRKRRVSSFAETFKRSNFVIRPSTAPAPSPPVEYPELKEQPTLMLDPVGGSLNALAKLNADMIRAEAAARDAAAVHAKVQATKERRKQNRRASSAAAVATVRRRASVGDDRARVAKARAQSAKEALTAAARAANQRARSRAQQLKDDRNFVQNFSNNMIRLQKQAWNDMSSDVRANRRALAEEAGLKARAETLAGRAAVADAREALAQENRAASSAERAYMDHALSAAREARESEAVAAAWRVREARAIAALRTRAETLATMPASMPVEFTLEEELYNEYSQRIWGHLPIPGEEDELEERPVRLAQID